MNTSTLARLSLALVLCLSASGSSLAQSDSKPAAGTNAKSCTKNPSDCDLNATITEIVAPDSPAFAVLGLSSTNASNPNSPAELAAAALNAFDTNGHFQSGAAIDLVPFLTFASKSFDLGQYTRSGMKAYAIRLLARTSVSFATTKGTSSPDTSIR